MARFDVYRAPDGDLWLDCQADVLSSLNSRFVVPLKGNEHDIALADRRLNPRFEVEGEQVVMLTHLAAAIPSRLLRAPVTSLSDHDDEIAAALYMLVYGF